MPERGRYADEDPFALDFHALMNAPTTQEKGVGRAVVALAAYAKLDGRTGSPEEIARDLFTDLLHLAEALAFDADWVETATDQHKYES